MRLLDHLRRCLPGNCILCGFPVSGVISLCEFCRTRLPETQFSCKRCGIALETGADTETCGRCVLHPPVFDLCRGVFQYREPVSHLITDFKFHADFASGNALGFLLARAFAGYYRSRSDSSCGAGQPHLLMPVPLHVNRLRKRGFNQALLLTRAVSRYTAIPLADNLLVRDRDTASQSQLPARQREKNLARAFRVAVQDPNPELSHVAVIDDVVTTTATARAVAEPLRAAGAGRIDIWAVARA